MVAKYWLGTAPALLDRTLRDVAVTPALAPRRPDPVRPLRPRLRRPAHEPAPVVVPPRTDAPASGHRLDLRRRAVPADLLPTTVDTLRPGDPVAPGGRVPSRGGPDGIGRTSPETRLGDARGPDAATRANGAASTDADLGRLAADMVRRMVEVLAGRRAPGQLAGAAQPRVLRYLTVSRDSGRGTRLAAAPRRIHVSQPTPDAAEIIAVCPFGPRSRALALRLDRDSRRRWHASAVRLL